MTAHPFSYQLPRGDLIKGFDNIQLPIMTFTQASTSAPLSHDFNDACDLIRHGLNCEQLGLNILQIALSPYQVLPPVEGKTSIQTKIRASILCPPKRMEPIVIPKFRSSAPNHNSPKHLRDDKLPPPPYNSPSAKSVIPSQIPLLFAQQPASFEIRFPHGSQALCKAYP